MAFTENFRKIEFNPDKKISEVFRATQGDTRSQGFNVVVFLGGEKKVITTETMSFFAQKPDGTRVTDMAVKDGDGFKIELKNQVFAVPGVVVCTLVLRGANGEKLAGRNFKIFVARSMEDGAIISEDEREVLDKAFDLAIDIVPRLEVLDIEALEHEMENVTVLIPEVERAIAEADTATGNANLKIAEMDSVTTENTQRIDTAIATNTQLVTESIEANDTATDNAIQALETSVTQGEQSVVTAVQNAQIATQGAETATVNATSKIAEMDTLKTDLNQAETSRVQAENYRTTAETARVQAETTRASFYDTYNQELQELAEIKADKDYTDLQLALKADRGEIGDIQDLQSQVSDLQAFVGYTDDDIMGVEVDFKNRKFTRLAGAVNRTPGEMFDDVQAFGGRKRCILTDDGVVLAYHGESGYTETGALTQAIVIELEPAKGEEPAVTETYEAGTKVQVMVEQPKFYYKVVPLQLDKVVDGKGFHMRKARYYVSDVKKAGFKLHPAFIHNGKEKNFIYLSAYEGSLYDVSASTYILDDAQIGSFVATTGDKLSSIANAKPASGLTQGLTRDGSRIIAQNRGKGWFQSYAATVAASQLLFLIEYASFNTQTAIGMGNVSKASGEGNESEITGATTNLGNKSGAVTNINGINIVSYRGEENFWGNIWKWIDGLNIEAKGLHNLYVADNGFADNTGESPYEDAGITLAKTTGYISAFAYNKKFDWLFFASETLGNSALPVGDRFYQNHEYNGWLAAILGSSWSNGSNAGGFYWSVHITASYRSRIHGGRLVYIPDVA